MGPSWSPLQSGETHQPGVVEHAELLGLAFPELRGGFEVRERILLGDARDAIVLHGTGALLDVLVVAQTPSGPVQVVVPLNDPTTCG